MPAKREHVSEELRRIRDCPALEVILRERASLQAARHTQTQTLMNPTNAQQIVQPRVLTIPQCIANVANTSNTEFRGRLGPNRVCLENHSSDANQLLFDSSADLTLALEAALGSALPTKTTGFYSVDELQFMDNNNNFVVPTSTALEEIKLAAINAMESASEEMKPCCVCELDCRQSEIVSRELTESFIEKMKRCLAVPLCLKIPVWVILQYDASSIDVRLQGLLLFPEAIYVDNENGKAMADVCKCCGDHILRSNVKGPPSAAIANGNYIGHLPTRFNRLSRTDEQAVALMLPCVSLSVVTGGNCKTIKSHHYIVRNTEGPIVEMLPRDLEHRVRVTMVGSMTPMQVAACKKRYDVNILLCQKFLHFLDLNNREYGCRQVRQGVRCVNEVRTSVVIDKSSSPDRMTNDEELVNSIRDESTYSSSGSTVDENNGDHSLENTWIAKSSLIFQSRQHEWVDVLVRKSNDYVSMKSWVACVKMFPTLFPGGCGGPTEPRAKRISVRTWILRCLRLHGHRFESHYAFMLLAFDFLASQNARETLYLKMNAKRQALKAAAISRSTILQAIRHFNYMSECRARGIKPRPPQAEVQRVIDLRKGLRVPESAFYGSNLGRMRARHDLFGLLKRFGSLQIFFTISPDSAGTYNIAIKAGHLSKQAIDNANLMLAPNRAERKALAATYPVECARYFFRVMDTVIEVLLGWDRKTNSPKRGGGIFGVVRGFGAAAETQLAGDLHAHFAVWLHGFPRTSLEFSDAFKRDARFQERLVALINSVLVTTPPRNENACVRCHTEGELKPVVPGVDAFRRPPPGASAPTTSTCRACGANFKAAEIIDAHLEALAAHQGVVMNAQLNDFEKCRPPLVRRDNSLVTSLLVRDFQVHYWNHCRSCFKKSMRTPRGTICRFLKPEAVQLEPTLIKDGDDVHVHRPIGCEYVNPYNRVIMDSIKCNHDAQFVLSSGAKATAAYVIKYCFKNQNPVENQAALSLAAFAKAVSKTNALPPDTSAMERGYRILGSMLYTVTNGQEVAATMAALYILNERPFWFSHEFVHVNMKSMLQKHSESVEISVSQQACANDLSNQSSLPSDNLLEMYWKRQVMLENVPFIDICEQYGCISKNGRKISVQRLSFKSVLYKKLQSAKVLVLCGDELPDISGYAEPDQLEFYYTALLSLFKPHRQMTLLGHNMSPLASYRAFLHCGDPTIVRRMQEYESQWQDYHHAQRTDGNDEESSEENLLRTRAPATHAWPSGYDTNSDQQDNDDDIDTEDPGDYFDQITTTTRDMSTERLSDEASAIVKSVPTLEMTLKAASGEYTSSNAISLQYDFRSSAYASQIIPSAIVSPDGDDCTGTNAFIAQFADARTRLERLHEIFGPVPYRLSSSPPRWTEHTLPAFPEIAMVSEAFEFNFWQHVIFEIAARHLLWAYYQDIEATSSEPMPPLHGNYTPYDVKSQLIVYLGGEAGTGKSRVVEALLVFANKWGRAGSVETLAFTGVAAINIKGRTMHSARNLKLNGTEPNTAPTVQMKMKYSQVVLVIIDEISITDQALLGGTDAVSRSMSRTPERFMGGKHTILIGDHLQLPPVAGSPCFQVPSANANRFRHAGYALYTAINCVVFLTRNMRARFDAEYIKILDDLRWGRLSDHQLARLNTRVQTPTMSTAAAALSGTTFYRPIVVCTNKLRCAINHSMVFQVAYTRKIPVYECLAVPSSRSRNIVENIRNANDDLTDRIPMKLLFYMGMPVMITRKHPELLEADVVANGVVGTIVGVHPAIELLETTTCEISGVRIQKLVQLPELLLIKLDDCRRILVKDFPEGVIGLPPLHISVRLNRIPNLSQASVTVRQFAVVAAFSCTTEKLQGKTCSDGVVVTPLDRRSMGSPWQTLYVALSRAISLVGLTLTEPITLSYLDKFKPTESIIREMQRLIDKVVLPPYTPALYIQEFMEWKAGQCPITPRQN